LYIFDSKGIDIVGIVTVVSNRHKNAPHPLPGSNFKFSCSFKFFTVEKKYTEIAFPGFIYVTRFYVAGLGSVGSKVEVKRFQEVLALLFSSVFDPGFDGQR